MATIPYAIIQLHHDKNTKIPVKTDWIFEFDKIKETLKTSKKYADPVFFFYHKDSSISPTFSSTSYSKNLDPDVAACYKGFISNRIYDSYSEAVNAILHKRIPFATQTKSTVVSEVEMEAKLTINKRKRAKKELTVVQATAKNSNGSYVVDALKKLATSSSKATIRRPIHPPVMNVAASSDVEATRNNKKSDEPVMNVATSSDVEATRNNTKSDEPVMNVAASSDVEATRNNKKSDEPVMNVATSSDVEATRNNKKSDEPVMNVATSSDVEATRNNTKSDEPVMNVAASSDVEATRNNKKSDRPVMNVAASSDVEATRNNKKSDEPVIARKQTKEHETPTSLVKTRSQDHSATSMDKDASDSSSDESDCIENSELTLTKKRLKKKTAEIKILKASNEKLGNTFHVLHELNVHWQRKHFACNCAVEMKQASPKASTDAYTFTAEQKMALASHKLPTDKNKYVVDMAKVLFTIEDLNTKTGAQLDKPKISFMSKYLLENGDVFMSEPEIKEVLNKRRLNNKRPRSETKSRPQSKKRLKMDLDEVDDDNPQLMDAEATNDVDLNSFLLLNMTIQENDPPSDPPISE